MAELTRDGAAAGTGGLVIANISKYGVINGKLINPAYSDSGEPDRATLRDPLIFRDSNNSKCAGI